jgi:hypothetical protein
VERREDASPRLFPHIPKVSCICAGTNISIAFEYKCANGWRVNFFLPISLTFLRKVITFSFIAPQKRFSRNWKKSGVEQRATEMLEAVGLGDRMDSRPAKLSGWQQRRVAVARALAPKPKFILAGEPTANMGSKSAEPPPQHDGKAERAGKNHRYSKLAKLQIYITYAIKMHKMKTCSTYATKMHKMKMCSIYATKMHKIKMCSIYATKMHKMKMCSIYATKMHKMKMCSIYATKMHKIKIYSIYTIKM